MSEASIANKDHVLTLDQVKGESVRVTKRNRRQGLKLDASCVAVRTRGCNGGRELMLDKGQLFRQRYRLVGGGN